MTIMLPSDDELLAKARQATGIEEETQLVHDALRANRGAGGARTDRARRVRPQRLGPNEGDAPPA